MKIYSTYVPEDELLGICLLFVLDEITRLVLHPQQSQVTYLVGLFEDFSFIDESEADSSSSLDWTNRLKRKYKIQPLHTAMHIY